MQKNLTVVNGFLLDIECVNEKNEKVYPYLLKKRGSVGEKKFDVSISGRSNEYQGKTIDQLIDLFARGVFDRGAQLRMKPKNGGDGNAKAPNKGKISSEFRLAIETRRQEISKLGLNLPAQENSIKSSQEIPIDPLFQSSNLKRDTANSLITGDSIEPPVISDSEQSDFEHETNGLNTTERNALVKVRYGQGRFREALFKENGEEKCWMSGVEGRLLLVASHIKPWSRCIKPDGEPDGYARGDRHNGLLLSSLWDAAFDAGLISFDDSWRVIASDFLSVSARSALKIDEHKVLPEKYRSEARKRYLEYHHEKIFKGEKSKI